MEFRDPSRRVYIFKKARFVFWRRVVSERERGTRLEERATMRTFAVITMLTCASLYLTGASAADVEMRRPSGHLHRRHRRSVLTASETNEALNTHNRLRRLQGASGMQIMVSMSRS